MTKQVMAKPEVLTAEESAKFLRIGRSLFFDLVRDGRIRVLRLGRRTLVTREELDRVMREGTSAPQTVEA